MRKETCLEDLWRMVKEEMKVMWPISIRREMLFGCKQKSGQAASDFYLELKAIGEDCELEHLGPEGIICHLLVRGLLGSEERLRERIIIDSEGEELKDKRLANIITSSEVYKASTGKTARASRGEARGPRDRREVRQRDKSERGCFRCGDLSHYRANCSASVYCKECNSDNHNAKTCWKKEVKKASGKKTSGKGEKPSGKKGKKGRNKVNEVQAEVTEASSSEDDYESSEETKGKSKGNTKRIRVSHRGSFVRVSKF